MSEGTQHPDHKESFMEKILDHHKHDSHENESQKSKEKPREGGGFHADLKKEEEKFKNYIKEDETLEQEGRTYGGLM
ncbi:hypothetical protein N7492_002037 [Penicillium capsulatum]|uniref:Uncharacterized protein n=1 Tax=Penicillium capsulatum TaxID=69766 RepID=A0A9W9IJA4_9EURO|nr:hypothetical protein N7492_002037 [Penicillium capsulatum]KAJ6123343.1 hypothetical protein N7512_005808 [Penicillium capsulatum]